MSGETPLDTARLRDCVRRWQQGDRAAADELLRACAARLEHLARRMLRGYPTVRGGAETADVLQGGLVRLLRALRSVSPAGTRDFYGLAAVQTRRELTDLARHFACRPAAPLGADAAGPPRPDAEELELWCRYHQEVEALPAAQREVVSLAVYHGWPQARIAELLGVDERTVRRHWRAATQRLAEALGGRLPGL